MLVSIIIPVFNVCEYLEKCLYSIMNQSFKDIEIILIDDGSTDGSEIICDKFVEKDLRIKTFHKKNGGLSSARNFGLSKISGDYVCFIDSDDWIDKNFIFDLYSSITQFGCDVACCGRKIFDGTRFYKSLCPKNNQIMDGELFLKEMLLFHGTNFSFCDKMFKSSLFSNVLFPEGKYFEDTGTMYKIIPLINKAIFVPKMLYIYNQRINSITHSSYEKFDDLIFYGNTIVGFVKCNYPKILISAKTFLTDCYFEQFEMILIMKSKTNKKKYLKHIIANNYRFLSFKNKIKFILILLGLFNIMHALFISK